MKIPINLLKTCPINSEIYRDSDVGDLVNSMMVNNMVKVRTLSMMGKSMKGNSEMVNHGTEHNMTKKETP